MNKGPLSVAAAAGCVLMIGGCGETHKVGSRPTAKAGESRGTRAPEPPSSSVEAPAKRAGSTGTFHDPDRAEPPPFLSIVLLRQNPSGLTAERVKEIIDAECGAEVAESMGRADNSPEFRLFMFKFGKNALLVHDVAEPYVKAENILDVMKKQPNQDVERALLFCRAWTSIDFVPINRESMPRYSECLDLLGRIAARMYGDCVVAVYSNGHDQYVPSGVMSAERLAAGNVDEAFPQFLQQQEASAMNECIAEARRRYPEFLETWRSAPEDKGVFLLKARFQAIGGSEHMWIDVEKIEGNDITGKLVNQPSFRSDLKKDDIVTVRVDDLSDWVYSLDEKSEGGFTDPSMRAVLAMMARM